MPLKCVKRYRLQDLYPGMVLGKTILNEKGQVMMDQGKVIFQEGTLVTRELVDRLRNWNIRVADVRVAVSPAAAGPEEATADREGSVAEMLGSLAGTEILSEFLDRLAHEVGRQYPMDHVFITLLEGTPARWWMIAAAGSFRLPDAGSDQKFQGAAYLAGQTVIIGDLSSHRAPPVLARADMMSMCGVPIVAEGVTVGALEIFSQRPDAFVTTDAEGLALYAKLAAVSIRCANKTETLRQTAEERDLLYEIMGFVSAAMPPAQLLSKVADSLSNYFCAHAVASFSVQRLPLRNKTTEVLNRNFSRTDLENLKDIFAERWPSASPDEYPEQNAPGPVDLQQPISVTLSAGKSLFILPLFSRNLLQGFIVLLWEYERKNDEYRHMNEMVRIVAAQTAMGLERHHLYTGVEKIGLTDELTRLSNRRMFNFLMDREISRSRRYGRPFSLLMLDIDHFKKVNDVWGHPAGDLVLRELGALMRENFRKLDVPVRYGGEEFAAILPETALEEAIQVAERFRILVEKTVFQYGKERIPVTVSIGVATLNNLAGSDEFEAEDLIQIADRALYQAKQNGRNRIAAGRGQKNSWPHAF